MSYNIFEKKKKKTDQQTIDNLLTTSWSNIFLSFHQLILSVRVDENKCFMYSSSFIVY